MTAAPYTITCDQAGCPATLTASTCASVERAAQAAGWVTRPWQLGPPPYHLCPQHWNVQDRPA